MKSATVRLADLCDLIAEPVKPGARPGALYLGLEHLASGRLVCTGGGQASEMRSTTSAFQPGDVLYGKLRPYLDKAVLTDEAGVCTTELLVLRAKADVAPRFLVTVLHSPAFLEHAVSGTTGVQHPRTSWVHIREFEVPALAFDKQQQTADLLWLVHEAISQSEALLEEGQALKRAAMRTLFTRGLQGESQKETEIGPVPESWVPTPIVSIGLVKGGKRMPKGVSLTDENTGKPYIRVTDFQDHSIAVDQVLFVPKGHEDVIARYIISSDDIYISIAGTIGLVGQIPNILDGANLTENAAKICVTKPDTVVRYVMYALASEICQVQIAQAIGKNAQPKLALARVEQIKLPLPPTLAEQSEIVAILDAIDCKIDLHRKKCAVLDDLFKVLLHKLMAGEIRVADLDLSTLSKHNAQKGKWHEG